uniref:NIDO domain-containing protein n=1 Tax=Leptobrachium leishanense TaxID=445787 RepID=A0A8C5Q7R5_9ANUR
MHSLLLLLSVLTRCLGQSPRVGESIYPYGLSVGDKETSRKDDGASPEIPISEHFTFFGKRYRSLYVNNNGVISFGVNVSEYTPDPFPLADGRPFVAPLWTDVDNSKSGHVYYRESTDPALLQRINKDMAVYFPNLHYKATWAFVATWDKVPYYKSSSNKTNTFQAILHTDTRRSFIMLLYGEITWTTGGASGGNLLTGLGGIPAQNLLDAPLMLAGNKETEHTPHRCIYRVVATLFHILGSEKRSHNKKDPEASHVAEGGHDSLTHGMSPLLLHRHLVEHPSSFQNSSPSLAKYAEKSKYI